MARTTKQKTGDNRFRPVYIAPQDYAAKIEETRLNKIGEHIRDAYIVQRRRLEALHKQQVSYYGDRPMPQWDGGLDKQLKNHVSVWPRIARFLEQQCVAYEYLIPLVFMNWSSSTAPLPTHFLSPAVVQEYAAALPSFLEQLDSTLRSQWAQFQTTQTLKICSGLSEYDAAVFAIGDPLTPINGLFRYILAARLPSPEQMQIFEECAWEQAQATRWLLRQTAWAQLVPEEWLQ